MEHFTLIETLVYGMLNLLQSLLGTISNNSSQLFELVQRKLSMEYRYILKLSWWLLDFRKKYEYFKKSLFIHCTKKWRFPLRISSVNVDKFAVSYGFGQISKEILNGKFHILCSDKILRYRIVVLRIIGNFHEIICLEVLL